MTISIEYISNHLFVDGYWGYLAHGYFYCVKRGCPFSLLMDTANVSGKMVPRSCRSLVCPVHYHEQTTKSPAEIKKEILSRLRFVQKLPTDPQAVSFRQEHEFWNHRARRFSKNHRRFLLDIEALKAYALNHPEKGARQLNEDCGLALNPRSISNIILREKKRRGMTTNIKEIIQKGMHHVLGNDGEDVVVFGLSSSIHLLSTTTLIQGDGTFTCVVRPFTQLYVFHGLLNGVSYPLLYGLVRGKNQMMYRRLLSLVETIAKRQGVSIFDRSVRLIIDFELAFMKAAAPYAAGRNITCCFFHFVSNVKKRARPIIDALKKTSGLSSELMVIAEETKRSLMMIPLLPLDIISVDVVDLIIWRWKMYFRDHEENNDLRKNAFDGLRDYIVNTYVRDGAQFNREIWCVSGRATRTNNAAESSHAVLNSSVRVSGEVSIDMFLFAIEKQMWNATNEIRAGCPSHSKAIYSKRNELLACELSDFINGRQGVFKFLERCSLVMNIKNLSGVQKFTNIKTAEMNDPFDTEWALRNRALVTRSGLALYRTIVSSNPVDPLEVLTTVKFWSFRPDMSDVNTEMIEEDSVLSMVRQTARTSFIEIRNGLDEEGSINEDRGNSHLLSIHQGQSNRVFGGQSYRLVIRN